MSERVSFQGNENRARVASEHGKEPGVSFAVRALGHLMNRPRLFRSTLPVVDRISLHGDEPVDSPHQPG